MLGGVLLVSVSTLGYALHVFEAPVCAAWHDISGTDREVLCAGSSRHTFILNSFWMVIITMTTVGYGDLYPLTSPGRAIAILACFMGVIVIGLFVTGITSMSSFTPDEKRAFLALHKTQVSKSEQDIAARVMQAIWLYYRAWSAPLRADKKLWEDITSGVSSARSGDHRTPGAAPVEDRLAYAKLLRSLREWRKIRAVSADLSREKSDVRLARLVPGIPHLVSCHRRLMCRSSLVYFLLFHY